jgi:hypothetical protein
MPSWLRAALAPALLAWLVSMVGAECPNACSGHGNCDVFDQCHCYQNYQGNDCADRTCYFGLAHVDTPKGDLDGDGMYSGPLVITITGSEVYPWGTSEQYPNSDRDEGHFYMECSNKGICDRVLGECDCFTGYEGTACIRASCPYECNGHGTCESIKELAEQKGYHTNEHDVPTTQGTGQLVRLAGAPAQARPATTTRAHDVCVRGRREPCAPTARSPSATQNTPSVTHFAHSSAVVQSCHGGADAI